MRGERWPAGGEREGSEEGCQESTERGGEGGEGSSGACNDLWRDVGSKGCGSWMRKPRGFGEFAGGERGGVWSTGGAQMAWVGCHVHMPRPVARTGSQRERGTA